MEGTAILRFNPASTTYEILRVKQTYGDSAGEFGITSAAHLRAGEQSGSPPDTEKIPKVAKDF